MRGGTRLAPNPLGEALIFARRAADDIAKGARAEGDAVIPAREYDKKQEKARHALVTKEVDREHE